MVVMLCPVLSSFHKYSSNPEGADIVVGELMQMVVSLPRLKVGELDTLIKTESRCSQLPHHQTTR